LKNYNILRTKFSLEAKWHLHIIEVLDIEKTIAEVQEAMVDNEPYYFHIYDEGETLIIVFKNKVFKLDPNDEATWQEARSYGAEKLGIPEDELDFDSVDRISKEDNWFNRQIMRRKQKTKIHRLYLELSEKYGSPKDFWEKWCKERKTKQDKETIVLGAMLTQRVSWLNVEKALNNLQAENALSIKGVYQIGKKNIELLERLIKPSGFYKQKAKRVFGLCKFIIENHSSLERFFKQDLARCRNQLLALFGIGPETADSILLYAGGKPTFVIDEYTRRFCKRHNISATKSYNALQNLFEKNLPKDVKIYQDFHAMIVLEGRGTTWDLITKIQ